MIPACILFWTICLSQEKFEYYSYNLGNGNYEIRDNYHWDDKKVYVEISSQDTIHCYNDGKIFMNY